MRLSECPQEVSLFLLLRRLDDLQCCQTVAVVVSPDKMRSVITLSKVSVSRSLILLLPLLLPCLAQELARHRAQGVVTRVSYSEHGQ